MSDFWAGVVAGFSIALIGFMIGAHSAIKEFRRRVRDGEEHDRH